MTPEQSEREGEEWSGVRTIISKDEQPRSPNSGLIKSRSPGRANSSASTSQPDEAGARRATACLRRGGRGSWARVEEAAVVVSEAAAFSKHGVSCEAGKQRHARREAARAARRGVGRPGAGAAAGRVACSC